MEHVPVLGLILALALGLVSLTLVARLPHGNAPRGVSWLPVTLLVYNLWVAGFLAIGYLRDRVLTQPTSPLAPPRVDGWALALLALALAWLYCHVAQLLAFLGIAPTSAARRRAWRTLAGTGVVLALAWFLSMRSGDAVFFRYLVSLGSVAVFPAAFVASLSFLLKSRRLEDVEWRARLSSLALAYVALFACLSGLSIAWGRLSAVSRELPLAIDAVLELAYNVVAIVWVTRLRTWLDRAPEVRRAPIAAPVPHRARLFAESGITRREAEIIELICLGKTNQEIADQLFISLTTVKDHNYVTFQKLGVRNRTELTRLVLDGLQARPK